MLNTLLNNATQTTLDAFLQTQDWKESLKTWCQLTGLEIQAQNSHALTRTLNAHIAQLDALITEQLNIILHNPILQSLEARWRGLHYLIDAKEKSDDIHIRLLDINWQEIHRDLTRSMEFDQSELFAKIYSEEFGSPGGQPFGLLLGDYTAEIIGADSAFDLTVLNGMANIAAASFAPFIASVSAHSFGVDNFATPLSFNNIDTVFKQSPYARWQQLRQNPDTRFLGLTLPRVIMRAPYENVTLHQSSFLFQEHIEDNIEDYLWGNGCFAFGITVIRAFLLSAWPGGIRGITEPQEGGGIVEGLPVLTQHQGQLAEKFSTELLIDSFDESSIAELGLIPICQYAHTGKALFYSNSSIFDHKQSASHRENINMKLSSMLQYILCASRFAHYIKIMGRDWIGSLASANELERKLNRWLAKYVASNDADNKLRKRFPLQEAKVEISDSLEQTGKYNCVIYLRPKLQLEKVDTALKLVTELAEIKI